MQSWSICRDSSNESVYGQGGAQEEREAFQLEDPSVLAIKGLGQFREFHILFEFRDLMRLAELSLACLMESNRAEKA